MRRGIVLAGSLLPMAIAIACAGAEPATPGGPLVLVVIDTLRADHLPCYGYERDTAPALCGLAHRGVLFERAYTPRTQTTPAVASIFTGQYPHRHGVRRLGQVLPPQAHTLAEELSDRGYETAAFVSSFIMLDSFSGFAQGFGRYDDEMTEREPFRDNYERDAGATIARAAEWLATAPSRSFLFVHLIEPHGPYTPEEPYLAKFALAPNGRQIGPVPSYQRIPGVDRLSEYIGRYDGEIASADAALARLLEAVDARPDAGASTIVVTSDHGESQGEEGLWLEHGRSVGPAEAAVPLIVKFGGGEAALRGKRVEAPVTLVELRDTFLVAADGETGGLLEVARGKRAAPPPVTERLSRRGLSFAARGESCEVHWTLPADALGEGARLPGGVARWRDVAAAHTAEGVQECEGRLAREADAWVSDALSFRRDFAVSLRREPFEPGFPTRFLRERGDPVVPTSAAEKEMLRGLGYVEDEVREDAVR